MTETGGIAADRLLSFCQRIERLEEEKATLATDIKEVYAEAKSNGFNTKAVRQMVKERAMEPNERDESRILMDLYRSALGMMVGTPLGDAALGLAQSAPESSDTKH